MNITCTLRHHRNSRRLTLQLLRLAQSRQMNRERIRAAILFAYTAHLGQKRKTGEPFIIHPILVAIVVCEFGGTEDDLITSLLHDSKEDNENVSLEQVAQTWGQPVQQRIQALTKNYALAPEHRLLDAHGRLLQAMACHGPGIAATKLADRLHNSVTSQALTSKKLTQLQLENQHFFAPLADHIGAPALGRFLRAEPPQWWNAADDFLGSMRALQTPFLL